MGLQIMARLLMQRAFPQMEIAPVSSSITARTMSIICPILGAFTKLGACVGGPTGMYQGTVELMRERSKNPDFIITHPTVTNPVIQYSVLAATNGALGVVAGAVFGFGVGCTALTAPLSFPIIALAYHNNAADLNRSRYSKAI